MAGRESVKRFNMVTAFEKRGFAVDFREYLLTCWEDEMKKIQGPYDLVVICYNLPIRSIEHYPQTASTTWSAHLVDRNKAVFVNFGAPYLFHDYFSGAKTFVNTQGFAVNEAIAEEAVARLVGEKPFTGKSVVNID